MRTIPEAAYKALPFAERARIARANMPTLIDMGASLLPHDDIRTFDDERLVELAEACYICDVKMEVC